MPLVILSDLPPETGRRWQQQFVENGRTRHENIWRRTQDPETTTHSRYRGRNDARWRILHSIDDYVIAGSDDRCDLLIGAVYLWWNTALPLSEAILYNRRIVNALRTGGWTQRKRDNHSVTFERGQLQATIAEMAPATAVELSGRQLPGDYRVIDVVVRSERANVTPEDKARPWRILRMGHRPRPPGVRPRILTEHDIEELRDHLPLHVETGCGASTEAGVPPLSFLHDVYCVADPATANFCMGETDALPEKYFKAPQLFHEKASRVITTSLCASTAIPFYAEVKRLYQENKLIGPLMTNNYDGLASVAGIPERLFRYINAHVYPEIQFAPNAKGLLVVGSHSDRRKIRENARKAGLKVFYVDPESICSSQYNLRYPYPLESTCAEDRLFQMTAGKFARSILARL